MGLGGGRRALGEAWSDLQNYLHVRLRLDYSEYVPIQLGLVTTRGQGRSDSGQVVMIVDSHHHLDQASRGRLLNDELAATVEGRERRVLVGTETELGVVSGQGLGLGNADGDRGQAVECHGGASVQALLLEQWTKC